MTAPRDYREYLLDIQDAIKQIEEYINGLDLSAFKSDRKTQDAVVRNLEIVGEAVKRIPQDVRDNNPDIEWRPAAAMRDFLIHEYPEVDVDAVWDTVKNDLALFKKGIERVLHDIDLE